ncbi:MAG: peptide chain release factor subunit 1 [Actinomycetota bacterium]|nr:peptide chain release factor subunit 1 [Actinomycetota bacterium]
MVDLDIFDRLLQFRPSGAPVLSVYVGVDGGPSALRTKLESLVGEVLEQAEAEPSQALRRSLLSDVARVLDLAARGGPPEGSTVGIFACHRAGLYEEVVVPRRARDRAVVDATPYLRPLLAFLDESRRYCLVVLDRMQACLYELFMGELEGATIVVTPGKPGRPVGRDPSPAHRLFRETADVADEFIHATGAELLLVGGPEETVAAFLPFVPHHLRGRVAGTFAFDPRTMGPEQARCCAEAVVDRYERAEEASLVAEILDRVTTGGLGAAGIPWCLAAVNEEAVQFLLIDEEARASGSACDACGWLGLVGATCQRCGGPLRVTQDVIEEMGAAVIGASGRVEHVQAPTPLSQHSVAAFLRFDVPHSAAQVVG